MIFNMFTHKIKIIQDMEMFLIYRFLWGNHLGKIKDKLIVPGYLHILRRNYIASWENNAYHTSIILISTN